MRKILFALEPGAGSAHIMHSALNALVRTGHGVCAALRDAGAAVGVVDSGIALLAAPLRTDGDRGAPPCGSSTFSFVRMLHNTEFGDDRALTGLSSAWRNLFGLVRPDLSVRPTDEERGQRAQAGGAAAVTARNR